MSNTVLRDTYHAWPFCLMMSSVVRLQHRFLRLTIDPHVVALFQHGKFVLKIYRLEQQGVVDHQRPQILQGFVDGLATSLLPTMNWFLGGIHSLNSRPL
jgi:hypothetical protein